MASADALIHRSDSEPFGLVALEAIASGLPLIVPDEGDAAEIAEPAVAETCRARDVRSCVAAIERMSRILPKFFVPPFLKQRQRFVPIMRSR